MDGVSKHIETSCFSTERYSQPSNLRLSNQEIYPALSSNRYHTKTVSPSRLERKNYNILGMFDKSKLKHDMHIRKNTNVQKLPVIEIHNYKKFDSNSVTNTNKLMKLPAHSNFHGHNLRINKMENKNFGGLVLGVNRKINSKMLLTSSQGQKS